MSRQWRACLVGCGRMGATIDDEVRDRPDSHLWLPYSHAAGYTAVESTTLVAVADAAAEKAEAIRQRYDVPRCYTDYREMIEKEQPEIVSVATRPKPYAEIVAFAAEHGVKGIYCDKPLCCSMEEADRMVEACERNDVRFNYGTQRRYAPLYRKIRELIEAGELGEVQAVIAHCGMSSAFWGLSHAADMLLFLAGDGEIDFVQGTIVVDEAAWDRNQLNADPAIASGYVRFQNGVHAYLTASSGYEFEVSGTNGKIRTLSNGKGAQWRQTRGQWRELEEVPFPEAPIESGTMHLIQDLVEALETGRDTQGPIQFARRSIEILFGIIESSRQEGRRVPLPLANRSLYVASPNW